MKELENHRHLIPALKTLRSLGIDFQITGSLGLCLCGVVDREPKDLDIVMEKWDNRLNQYIEPGRGGSVEDGDEITNHISIRIACTNVCVFIKKTTVYCTRYYDGVFYSVANPVYAIHAKLDMLNTRLVWKLQLKEGWSRAIASKHASDIAEYFRWYRIQGEGSAAFVPDAPPDIPDSPDDIPW